MKTPFLARSSLLMLLLLSCGLAFSCRPKNMTDDEVSLYVEARELYMRGEYEAAIRKTGEGPTYQNQDHRALLLLAKSHFMNREPEKAGKILAGLTRRFPRYAEAQIWLARSNLALNRLDECERGLEEALEFNGEDPRLHQLMAELKESKGEYDKAFDYYSRASAFCDEVARIELSLSKLYRRFGQDERALFHVGRSRTMLSPDNVLYRPLVRLEERLNGGERP